MTVYKDSSPLAQPKLRVNGPPFDPELEVEPSRPGRRNPHAAERSSLLDSGALFHVERGKVAVQRERLAAMVQDYEASKSRERISERDDAVVDRLHPRALRRCDVDAVDGGRPVLETLAHGAGGGPFEAAAEWRDRQRRGLDRGVRRANIGDGI